MAYLHAIDEEGKMTEKPEIKVRFQNRIVGEGQYYAACAADIKISRRIRIPMYRTIDEDRADAFLAVIENAVYTIQRAQHYTDKKPPVTDLTLKYVRERT